MQLSPDHHLRLPFRVHRLAHDFELLDVWRFPLELDEAVPLSQFLAFFAGMQGELLSGSGPAARLFRLRKAMGRWFGWDDEEATAPLTIPGSGEHSLRERLSDEERARPIDLEEGLGSGGPSFSPVYTFERESLLEISNATVHALMHVGREPREPGVWAPQLAVYVRTRGALGRVYMAGIAPFRHGIVYPAMMRSAERRWPAYAAEHGFAT